MTSLSAPPERRQRTRAEVSADVHPIIPGFHPDPSICRVGDEYFIAHSSFEYFPGVPMWRSSDLLDWQFVGNALERPDQFDAGAAGSSKGIFAPTLRHHDGRFWLITTDVSGGGGQLLVSAEKAEGPWSAGTRIRGLIGIDPDLAWTDDGVCLVTYCSTEPGRQGIAQAPVDLATGELLAEPQLVWQGTGLAFPEAPHLYRRGEWWYLVIAEGGTERGHSVTIARSTSPSGPFEPAPHNPILSHRSTTHPVQNTGHADLVQTSDGGWAVVYLGVRPRGGTPLFHVLGRETFLAGVEWHNDWPVVNTDAYRISPYDTDFTDTFSGAELDGRWVSPGASDLTFVTPTPGGLHMRGGLSADTLVARVQDLRWNFELRVEPGDGEVALIVRLDDRHWCEVRATAHSVRAVTRIGPLVAEEASIPRHGCDSVVLRATAVDSETGGPDDILLGVQLGDDALELIRIDGRYLSTEVAGGFTGRMVGARAVRGEVLVASATYTGFDTGAGR